MGRGLPFWYRCAPVASDEALRRGGGRGSLDEADLALGDNLAGDGKSGDDGVDPVRLKEVFQSVDVVVVDRFHRRRCVVVGLGMVLLSFVLRRVWVRISILPSGKE